MISANGRVSRCPTFGGGYKDTGNYGVTATVTQLRHDIRILRRSEHHSSCLHPSGIGPSISRSGSCPTLGRPIGDDQRHRDGHLDYIDASLLTKRRGLGRLAEAVSMADEARSPLEADSTLLLSFRITLGPEVGLQKALTLHHLGDYNGAAAQ